MPSIDTLQEFLGLGVLVNIGLLLFVIIVMALFRDGIASLNAKIYGVSPEEAKVTASRIP
ncbi:MAG: hypothetical protein ACI84D_001682 [Thalassolituus oleivorans]|jgi:hypothetical protein